MPEIRSMGTTLYFGDAGAGSPVVALHGSASSGAQWRSLIGCLAGRHRVLTPDLAGYGRSGAPRGMRGLGDEATFLAPVVAAPGEPVHLVGHSFGGAVALEIARRMPHAVASVTAIEPAVFGVLSGAGPADAALLDEIAAVADTVAGRAAAGERAAAAAAFVDYWAGPGAFARSSPRLRGFVERCIDRVVANFLAIAAGPAGTGWLAGIACPVLALTGAESPRPAVRVVERVAAAIPGAQLVRLAGAGHMAPLTDPHCVDPLTAAHVASASAAGAGLAAAA